MLAELELQLDFGLGMLRISLMIQTSPAVLNCSLRSPSWTLEISPFYSYFIIDINFILRFKYYY